MIEIGKNLSEIIQTIILFVVCYLLGKNLGKRL